MKPSFRTDLAERIFEKREAVQKWFSLQSQRAPTPFYCSVDIRDSGDKIAPVDNNLFPAGFNNLCSADLVGAPQAIAKTLRNTAEKNKLPPFKRILLIPEANTKNLFYLDNLAQLVEIFKAGSYEVKIGWPDVELPSGEPLVLKSNLGQTLEAHKIAFKGGRIILENFDPDCIVLNNDFSMGYPSFFDECVQPIVPSHRLGWHSRRKSRHFFHYNRLAKEFSELLGIDPWHLTIDTVAVSNVNFNEGEGLPAVAKEAELMFQRIQNDYQRLGIEEKPALFIKNNSGTYGMGIHTITSSQEVLALNRREKNKMSVGKGKRTIDSVILQEGIPTRSTINGQSAEPVIYLIGCNVVGGFFRFNEKRGPLENLNSPGMAFKKLCMSDIKELLQLEEKGEAVASLDSQYRLLELVYGSVARISALSAGLESADILSQPT